MKTIRYELSNGIATITFDEPGSPVNTMCQDWQHDLTEVTAQVVTLAPGQETGWHTHGMPTLGYVLEGEIEVDYGSKGVRRYRAGEAVLEAIGVPHNGRNIGRTPMRILAVFMGEDGLSTTVRARR